MSHDAKGNRNDLIKSNTWYAERFKYLLDALKGATDADGPLLDRIPQHHDQPAQ